MLFADVSAEEIARDPLIPANVNFFRIEPAKAVINFCSVFFVFYS